MLMSKDRRLQVLVESEQYRRLADAAASRGVSVATVVREAVGHYLDAGPDDVRDAVDRVLAADAMDVPEPEDLRAELDDLRGRRE